MSGRSLVVLVALLMAGFAQAQTYSDEMLKTAVHGCIAAIKSDHAGLRESGVLLAAKIRHGYPNADLNKLVRELQKVMNSDQYQSIRVHAAMMIAYISDPFLYKRVVAPHDDDAFFGFYNTLNQELYNGFYETIQQIGNETMIALL
jgi:hypothetical protein